MSTPDQPATARRNVQPPPAQASLPVPDGPFHRYAMSRLPR
ncbi:hypothetical protein ACFWVF_05610 [Streptomyces sp. NPDC058659]